MAYELVNEVIMHGPADLTPAERMVLVVIANAVFTKDYQRGGRRTSMPAAELARLAGLKATGLKDCLQRLAKRKIGADRTLELRVPLATGRDGRPVYAIPGQSATYEIPHLPAPADCFCSQCKQDIPTLEVIHKAGPQPPLGRRKGRPEPRVGEATPSPGEATASPSVTSEDAAKVQAGPSKLILQGEATASPNRVPGPGNPGPRARAAARPAPADEDLDTIIEEMADHAGETITPDHARRIYREVLDRAATPPRYPLSYVLKAVRAEPHRYRPTPIPPPVQQQPRQMPLVAVAAPPPFTPAVSEQTRTHLRTGWKTHADATGA